jgi:hypothetical protein
MIRKPLPYMIDMVVGLFEEGRHVMVINPVIDDIALTPRFDEATFPEEA